MTKLYFGRGCVIYTEGGSMQHFLHKILQMLICYLKENRILLPDLVLEGLRVHKLMILVVGVVILHQDIQHGTRIRDSHLNNSIFFSQIFLFCFLFLAFGEICKYI